MKKFNFFICCAVTFYCAFLFNWSAQGQVSWFENNDEWQFYQLSWENVGNFTIKISGDTLIGNKACKILTSYYASGDSISRFVYQEGEAIYVKDIIDESFYVIYDFSLESGETVTMPFSSYQISSTGVIDIGGVSRRYQIVNFIDGSSGLMIIEGIGMVGKPHLNQAMICSWLFPDIGFCSFAFDGQNIYFRCFAGNGIYYSPFNNCVLSTSLNEKEQVENLRLFPNPVSAWLRLETGDRAIILVEIFDLTGRRVWRGLPDEGKIDCRLLENGVYFLHTTDRQGKRLSELFRVMQ